MTKLFPLVDADYLLYRVGYAVKEGEPVEYALSTMKHAILNIWEEFDNQGILYLTGKNNYRDKVATIQIYKGNRDPTVKPFYYYDLKDYMIHVHGAQVIDHMEADDKVGIEQYARKDRDSVIVGVDKDLLCIPGWHYNPVKNVKHYQNLADANKFFWLQVLTGDRTDHIRGIEGMGPKGAEAVLANKTSWIDMAQAVKRAYESKYGSDGARQMHETATLIHIQRKHGINYDGTALPMDGLNDS